MMSGDGQPKHQMAESAGSCASDSSRVATTRSGNVMYRVLPNCIAKAKGERAPLIGGAVLRTPDLSSLTVR